MRRILITFLFLCGFSVAQTGFPLWGSFEVGPFDSVNRQNLNVNFSVPIVSVPSRGGSFAYTLIYDSLIWTKSGTSWVPVTDASGNATWGWKDNQALGSTKYNHVNELCDTVPPVSSPHYFGYRFTDGRGTIHNFGIDFYLTATACQFNTGPRTAYATDGSGYYMDATAYTSPTVYSPAGDKINGTYTDANGNYVSGIVVNSSETDYKDTNGRITLKKIKSGSTQIQYQLLDQTGSYSNAIATATYSSKNVKTAFGCSGIGEYTATSVYLITSLSMPNGQSYIFSYEATPNNSGYVTGRLQRIALPTGGYYEYDYPATPNDGLNCTDGSVKSVTRTVNDGSTSSVWQFSGTGTQTTETYPQLSYDSVPNTAVFAFSTSNVTQQKSYQGPATGTPLRTVNTSYSSGGGGNTIVTTTTILEDNSTQCKVVATYDHYANLLKTLEYAWGVGSPGSLVRETDLTYLTSSPYVSANILNRVTQVLVKDGSGNLKSRTDTTYDAYGSNMSCVTGAAQHNDSSYGCSYTTRGNPTSITRYSDAVTPSGGITTDLYYDSLGNVITTDVGGVVQEQTTFSSTTQWSSPDSVKMGPSSGPQLTTSATYNTYTSLMATSIDANNQSTQYTYDNLRRLTDIQRPDGTHFTSGYDDVNKKVTLSSPVQGSDVIRKVSYQDGLGRVTKVLVADVNNNSYSIMETQYDSWGRSYRFSVPHNSTAQYWSEVDVDAIGRTTKRLFPDSNQTTYSYATTTVTATDPSGHQNKQDVDALGRVIGIYEPDVNNGNTLTQQTVYSYDALDDMTGVTGGSQTRTYVYDSLGRISSVTLPESGQTQYQYNAFDQPQQRTDARGVITTLSYDSLNRLYQISYNVGSTGVPPTPTITYAYGTTPAQFNNGRLITLTASGVEADSFTYDQLGRVTNVSKNITGAQTYNVGYGYNLAGELASTTYPSGRVVSQTYDGIGRLSQVSDGTRTYASQFSYNPAQQLQGYAAGNSVQASYGYSAQRLQLTTLSYTKGSNTLFSLGYGYSQNGGDNGQMTTITDNVTSSNSLTLTYDSLGRLSRGRMANLTVPNSWDISWGYDRFGNRATQSLNGGTLSIANESLTFDPTRNQPTGAFAFDSDGNMTNDGVITNYVYDAQNRFVQLGTSVVNVYDANNLRIKKTASGSTTVYVFAGSEVIAEYSPSAGVGAPSKEYIYLDSQLLASLDASHNPTYRHSDHLSVRVYTDANGNVVGSQGHLPFGDTWYSSGAVDKWKFTTYESDSDTNLDYAVNRFLIPRFGRFMTTDPYNGSIDTNNPSTWDRYPYVANDPCDLVDALGLADCFFNIAVKNTQNLTDKEAKSAWGELERILGLADIGAIFTDSKSADFTINLAQNPTSVSGSLIGGVDFDLYGQNDSSSRTPTNSATVWQNNVEMAAGGMDMGVAVGRTMAHEFLHWGLGIGPHGITPGPLETGIMSQGALGTFMNGYATLSAEQISILRQKCKANKKKASNGGGTTDPVPGPYVPATWGFPFIGTLCFGVPIDGGWSGGCEPHMFYPY